MCCLMFIVLGIIAIFGLALTALFAAAIGHLIALALVVGAVIAVPVLASIRARNHGES